jgi:hypothetical protein
VNPETICLWALAVMLVGCSVLLLATTVLLAVVTAKEAIEHWRGE